MNVIDALQSGATQWIDAPGYELFPLNRFADRLKVVACENEPLGAGDLVIVRQADGRYAARIVLSPEPLRFAPLFSSATVEGDCAVGRVVTLGRRGRNLPVQAVPWLVRTVNALGAKVRESSLRRALTDRAKLLPYSGPAVALRRAWLGPFDARRLTPGDADEVRRLVDAELPAMTEFVLRQLGGRWRDHGIPIGAFSRQGRLCGMYYVDEYRQEGIDVDGYWMRALIVSPIARGLGLTRLMGKVGVTELYRLGIDRFHADVAPENRLVVETMIPWFNAVPAEPSLTAALNREFSKRGMGDGWTVWTMFRENVLDRKG